MNSVLFSSSELNILIFSSASSYFSFVSEIHFAETSLLFDIWLRITSFSKSTFFWLAFPHFGSSVGSESLSHEDPVLATPIKAIRMIKNSKTEIPRIALFVFGLVDFQTSHTFFSKFFQNP